MDVMKRWDAHARKNFSSPVKMGLAFQLQKGVMGNMETAQITQMRLVVVCDFEKYLMDYTANFSEHIGRIWNSSQVFQRKTF